MREKRGQRGGDANSKPQGKVNTGATDGGVLNFHENPPRVSPPKKRNRRDYHQSRKPS